ncbi:MAG: DNA mismatch repair protein MutS, partial [Legionellaceae bacterium]
AETRAMANDQREEEQQGHRRFARVHARERFDDEPKGSPEGEMQNDIPEHPWLGTKYQGIDPDLNPNPPLNTEARRELDNLQLEKQLQYRLQHGLTPSSAPKPRQ